ncbi:MAG: type IX secretion system membrane protein PorP/SprF [Saprospiraceae bacterium]|nr:type IX secretion system membrane protein PorP/SprF [Saprospiraceae bacterium]
MKRLTIILILTSSWSFGQDAIFNVHKQNLHLLNYAFLKKENVNLAIDNSFEYYSKDKIFNTTNLNFDLPSKNENKIKIGCNIKSGFLGEKNNISDFDAIFKYKYNLNHSGSEYFSFASNLGLSNNQISYKTLNQRYSFKEFTPSDVMFNKLNFNVGVGGLFHDENKEIGVYVNHLNRPNLPIADDKTPIKYTAYLRNYFWKIGLYSTLIYQYQDGYFYNQIDLDYYYCMLNYLGVNFDYELNSVNLGLGFKHLSNTNNIYSANLDLPLNDEFNIVYSASIMQNLPNDKLAHFHQIGMYFHFGLYYPFRRILFGHRHPVGKIHYGPSF